MILKKRKGNVKPIWVVGLLVFTFMFIMIYFGATSGYLDFVVGNLNGAVNKFLGLASGGKG